MSETISVSSISVSDNPDKMWFSATHARWKAVNADLVLEFGFDDGSDTYSSLIFIFSPESALAFLDLVQKTLPDLGSRDGTDGSRWAPNARRELKSPPRRATNVYAAFEHNSQMCELAFGAVDMIQLFNSSQLLVKDDQLRLPAFAKVDMARAVAVTLVAELRDLLQSGVRGGGAALP